jgi:thiol:disulfide interchange protein DsbC
MKKIVMAITISGALFAKSFLISTLEKKEVLNSIYKVSPILKLYINQGLIKARVFKDKQFYIVKLFTPQGSQNLYLTLDKRYLISGEVIDLKTRTPLLPPANKEIVKKGVMFSFGKGKKDIYIVTDPECPFCRKLEKEKGKYLAKHYRIHIILFPLSFHKNAKAMSYYILAGKTDKERVKRMQEILKGSDNWKSYKPTKEEKRKFDKELKKAKKAAVELGVSGTPSVYDEDFNAINWTKLGAEK